MPRYFFDITDGTSTFDDTGNEFADLSAARDAAIQTLSEMARDEIGRDKHLQVAVLMRGECGQELFRASLALSAEWLVELPE